MWCGLSKAPFLQIGATLNFVSFSVRSQSVVGQPTSAFACGFLPVVSMAWAYAFSLYLGVRNVLGVTCVVKVALPPSIATIGVTYMHLCNSIGPTTVTKVHGLGATHHSIPPWTKRCRKYLILIPMLLTRNKRVISSSEEHNSWWWYSSYIWATAPKKSSIDFCRGTQPGQLVSPHPHQVPELSPRAVFDARDVNALKYGLTWQSLGSPNQILGNMRNYLTICLHRQ